MGTLFLFSETGTKIFAKGEEYGAATMNRWWREGEVKRNSRRKGKMKRFTAEERRRYVCLQQREAARRDERIKPPPPFVVLFGTYENAGKWSKNTS